MKKISIILGLIIILCTLILFFTIKRKSSVNISSPTVYPILTISHSNTTYTISNESSSKILKILNSLQYNIEQTDNLPDYTINTDTGEVFLLNTFSNCVLHNGKQSYLSASDMSIIISNIQ